jgi:trehalose 6-phosphate phosphatase
VKILNPQIGIDQFFKQLNKAKKKALLLDYDGTLAPFHIDPSKAYPYPGIRDVLNKLIRVPDIRLVIISGRWIKELLPLLQLDKTLEIWGSHGLERRKPNGSYEIASMNEKALHGLAMADDWIEKIGLSGRCEKKPGALALHWRGLDDKKIGKIVDKVTPKWSFIAGSSGLSLAEFDGGLELRVPVRNKGDVIRTILEEMGPGTVAAYLGDDLTDEDAFKSIKGKGIGVLVRNELRPTAADIWIKPPNGLLEFLSSWLPENQKIDKAAD